MLDLEKGFIFIDERSCAYAIKMLDGSPWLLYWNEGQKCFTTLRPATQNDIFAFGSKALPQEQADLYFNYGK